MSSEFLDYLEKDEKGASVSFDMNAHGYAWLAIMDKMDEDGIGGGNIEKYCLSPDEKGWKAAEMIAAALTDWITHTKRIHNAS
jgi:hypothetical protein